MADAHWKTNLPSNNIYYENPSGVLYNLPAQDLLQTLPAGFIDLIYIDPPFGIPRDKVFGMEKWNSTEEHYKFLDSIGLSIIKKIDQRKRSNRGIAHYLYWLYSKLQLMKNVLKDTGTIYVHLDHHMDSYIRILLDEIFGKDNFRNEIVWCYTGPASSMQKHFKRKHDTILWYSKSADYIFNADDIRVKYKKPIGQGGTSTKWTTNAEELKNLAEKYANGKIPEDWWGDITPVARLHATELLNFQTQKPEALLERIIKASSNPDSIVADFFAGSGTTAAVAQKLGRRWIASDINEKALLTTKNRILKENENDLER